jgi:putative toxin-antitoxin system antitoxin component (TIGR02293 family)
MVAKELRARRPQAASGRAERLTRIVALARQVLGNADEATDWLNRPHLLLNSARPIKLAATDLGARQVERILRNIEHGLPV